MGARTSREAIKDTVESGAIQAPVQPDALQAVAQRGALQATIEHQQLNDKKRSMVATLNIKMSAITKEVEATRNSTKLAVWDSELFKLLNDFDLFMRTKEDVIQGVSDEMGLVKVQYELDACTKDFQLKLDAAKKMIEQKESTLESIDLCGKEVDIFVRNILLNIPDSPNEDFMDFATMEKQIEPLKSDVAGCFEGNIFFTSISR